MELPARILPPDKCQIPGNSISIGNWKLKIENSCRRRRGFTLIELLIVISIIGILTALLTANFVGVRQRARDAQRKSDLRQIQSALELYRTDVGTYPVQQSPTRLNSTTACTTSQSFVYNSTTYTKKIPCDPLGTSVYNGGNYYYYTDATGTTYTLATCLENSNDSDTYTTASAPVPSGGSCSSGKYYVVTNP